MPLITKKLDGKYYAYVVYQDGSDVCVCDSLEEAIRQFPKAERKSVKFTDLTIWPTFVADAKAAANISHQQMEQALHIAALNLEPGVRYELQVKFVPLDLPFLGDGI